MGRKEIKTSVLTTPVRGQQHHFRTELGNRKAPWDAGRAEEQTMDDIQPKNNGGQNRTLRGEQRRSGIRCR
jgi:hypothetical protein